MPNGPPDSRATPGWASTAAATASASAGSWATRHSIRRYVDAVSLDDLTLVVRAQEGDVRAFEALARRHQAALYRIAVRVMGDPAEAEDALQEALLDAWRHLDRFRGDAAFSTWMYRLVTNRCVAALRRRRPTPVPDAGTGVAARDSPERAALFDLELAALGRAVQDLPDDLRVCWVLRELEGLGYSEIAEITGAGETAVRGRIHRARVRLAGVMRAGDGRVRRRRESSCWPAAGTPRRCGTAPRRGSRSTRTGGPARTARPPTPRPGGSTSRCTAWPRNRSRCPRGRGGRPRPGDGVGAQPGRGPRRRCGWTRRSGPTGSPARPRPRCCAPSSTPWTGCAPAAAASTQPGPGATASTSALTVAARFGLDLAVRDRPGPPDGASRRASRRWGCRCAASTSRWWTCGRRDAAT